MAASGVVAGAQAPPTPATPQVPTAPPAPTRITDCAPLEGNGTVGQGTTTDQSREPLGDKLARSDGVLCPPADVDPQMRAPTPRGGSMPVVPPPGSLGGDPTIRPK